MSDDTLTLRSYRLAFELERRLHRIDRFRIPVPYGIPLAGLGYAGATALLVLLLTGVPFVGDCLALLPWPIRLLLLPGASAHLLCRPTSDGRPVHEALVARLLRVLQPRRLIALKAAPPAEPAGLGEVTVVSDERGPCYRPGTIKGPAVVLLRQPARLTVRRGRAELRSVEDRPMSQPTELALAANERLFIR